MTDLTAYGFHGHSVRVASDEHEEPWFVAKDVCAVLGIVNASDAVGRLDPDGVGTTDLIDTMGRLQTASTVNEPGLYELVFQSRRPEAREFRRWVTTEVLPSIRKTGQYGVVSHITKSDLARMVIDSEAAKEIAEARVLELEPPAKAWTALADAAGDYSLRDAAQILSRDHGVDTGQNRLMDSLRDWGWVDAKDRPYQRVVDQDLLRLKVQSYDHPRTNVRALAKPQVRISTKGLERILTRLTEAS